MMTMIKCPYWGSTTDEADGPWIEDLLRSVADALSSPWPNLTNMVIKGLGGRGGRFCPHLCVNTSMTDIEQVGSRISPHWFQECYLIASGNY